MGRPSRVLLSTAAAAALVGSCLVAFQAPAAALPAGGTRADFNADGYADLAIGAPFDDVGTVQNAGAVNVLYGSAAGLRAAGSQLWHQDSVGVGGAAEAGDGFGASLCAGDFNGDGYADLAIGAPREGVEVNGGTTENAAGVVQVLYGGPTGLSAAGSRVFNQGLAGTPEALDLFGETLAAGDFDGDGDDDLAVGASNERIGTVYSAGAVLVLPGSPSGLTTLGVRFLYQGDGRTGGVSEENDRFGWALAAGDFNGDEMADLLIGVPGQTIGGARHTGAAHALYGGTQGIGSAGSQVWSQNTAGVPGTAEDNDDFGGELTSGDFNGDGYADAAIAVTGDRVGTASYAGTVHVMFGGPSALRVADSQLWSAADLGEAVATSDQFGTVLTAGDFNGDGISDLVVGVPYQGLFVGLAHVIYGSADGPTPAGSQRLQQGTAGLPETAEAYDSFGEALAADDYNGDGHADLAVGAPGEDLATRLDAGMTHVINGSARSLITRGSQVWHQNSPGIAGVADVGDSFGSALSQAR